VALWITEALPLPVSAMLAAATGVAPANEVFRPFFQALVFLFSHWFFSLAPAFYQKLYRFTALIVVLHLPCSHYHSLVSVQFE
jgi:hypothetical protein